MKSKLTKLFTILAVLIFGIGNVWGTATNYHDFVAAGDTIIDIEGSGSTPSAKMTAINGTDWAAVSTSAKNNSIYRMDPSTEEVATSKTNVYGTKLGSSAKSTYKVTGVSNVIFYVGTGTADRIAKLDVTEDGKSKVSEAASVTLSNKNNAYKMSYALDASKSYTLEAYASADIFCYAVKFTVAAKTSYTVTYKAGDGTGADVVDDDATVVADCPGTFSYTGHDFAGWKDAGDNDVAVGATVTEDMTLTAQWVTHIEKFTVVYKDGATELGSEVVNVGDVPAGIAAPTKDCYTFAGWDPALNTVSGTDGQVINVNATWTSVYASSFNFGTTTDLTKDNIATKLAASNIFCSVGTGGSYDAGGTTGYLGYKFKNNGDYVTFLVQDGYEAIVTYGYTESGWQVNGVDAGVTVKTQAYVNKTYQTDGSDLLLKLVNQSANSKTSVLTNIVIKVIAAGDDDATLSDLSVSGFTLSPAFASATEDYTITKEYGAADPVVGDVTATPSVTGATAAVVWDGTNHKFVVTVTAKDGVTKKTYNITVNEAEAKRGLLTVPFSNGAKGAINAAGLEIRVPYIGASEPTIVLAGIEYQSGVAGATASMEAGKLRITGADSNYDDYTLTFVQLTPSALTLDELVTFDDVPSYAFAPYGWDSGKGVKFAKNVEEASNHRVSLGNTRVYFAIQACDEVQLTSGSGGARNVKIYVNGVLSSVNKTAASGSAIKLALDNTQANFIAIESNQTGGDGGFTKILVKALADNTLAYTDGAYTTGEAALDLSTLISTSNSDGAITYAVKTDGGTNASIAGNNFTATVAGTATITATQVASETIRQKSVDFNVVVTAGATKYTVTFDAQGGSAVDPQEVTEGESPVVPTAPTKDEYIFQGWSETTDGAVVDVTSFTINAPKTFYAIWVAEPAGIKLLDGSTVNHTNFITGVTADETVEFKGNTVNYAKFSGTVSGVNSVKDLTRVIAYNATTNQTKIRISAHNNSTSARNILVKGLVEGAAAAVDLATIALGNKEDKVSEWIEFNNAANRTIYIMVPSSAGDVYFTQVKVIEDGATPMKQAGEAGYALNLNKGRFFGLASTDLAFEGLNARLSGDYTALNSGYAKLKETSMSFTIASAVTLSVTTNNNKTYYVTKGSAGTDNETAKTGVSEFDLTAGTWYITGGTSEVQITNIAFSAPKCAEPVIDAQPATKIDFAPGDLTASVTAHSTDGGTLSYKWYNASDDSEVAGATSATLTTTTEGTYYVIVTNSLADHADNSLKSDEATLRYRSADDATLSSLTASAGSLDPAFDPAVENYRVDLPEGTTDVPTLTATAAMAAYGATADVTDATVFVDYEAVSTVLVTAEDGSTHKTYTVHFYVAHSVATLVDVTENTTWDWTAVTKKKDGTTISGDGPIVTEAVDGLVIANYLLGDNFDKVEGNNGAYALRSDSRKVYQGASLHIHTTKGGYLSIWAANEGTTQTLNVNNAGRDMKLATLTGSQVEYKVYVNAGDVVIYNIPETSGKPMRVSKMIFTVDETPDYTRSVTNNIGTLCVDHNVPAGGAQGATFYQIAGKNAEGKLVFEEVTSLNAGEPYVFQSTTGGITLYYGETTAPAPVAVKGMIGSFSDTHVDIDDSNKTNIMYIANNKLWDCSDLVGSYLDVVANRAYIFNYAGIGAAPAHAPGKRYIVVGKDQATGFDQLETSEAPMKLIIDGQLFILRGEKMYNANGQLVK